MVNDPYKVLGITNQATPEEIKSAYRRLAKKYHPDLHPDDAEASAKMNEINEAYDMLTHPEKYSRRRYEDEARSAYSNFYGNGGPSQNNGYQGFRGAGGWYSDFRGFEDFNFDDIFGFGKYTNSQSQSINPTVEPSDSRQIQIAISYINQGRYQEAFKVLMGVEHTGRNARWYYLNAITLYGYGDVSQACEYIKKAVMMEPSNTLYQMLFNQFRSEGQTYYRRSNLVFSPFRTIGRVILFIIVIRILFRFLALLLYGIGGLIPPVM